ncbi:thiamine pyrophosphate-binding protein [Azospirillum brasilense]|uniref:Thiamine pyrophosphate-binding protein n=5 Tax=Pseudomonadota TaxID=1224 RepID=A0A0P0F6C7_AZOBR|nr:MULTISPECIES: thiamine pyrophosphate-binding protein [Azospirillum]ALJ38873.1 thiamine pyrophosphate-binding protein [Azospirillum brasilense]MDW7557088.1 thiamine pyrophosphate-binding protein [Azospirillum brasilense]MDW7596764.1 thiamine pyrophosphate-binding protein [Azospirillum brasilense]MDW7631872.1 thiamine pyrophosphate-binding protein [Azospirillum brasilense]MDX5950737.1 thiamine pyrophosphate-binding protein [Azospirillum brasilense]
MQTNGKTGGQLIVEALEAQGVERVFCVPGESYLAVLDALHDSAIRTINARHESGAAMMAEAEGKLTGRPGICFVTRGPGATNAAPGVHVAQQDSTPMILFIGQIERGMRGRDAFQEVDYTLMFGGMAKWVAEIDSADRVPEMVSRAFHTALAGRPGPVVLVLPEDMLVETADVVAARPAQPVDSAPTPAQVAEVGRLLAGAKRPLVIAGGSRWTEDAVASLHVFAETFALPVAVTFRRQMLFDHTHPNYAGDIGLGINPKLVALVKDADVILLLGGRFSEVPSQSYGLLGIPETGKTLIHVHPGAEELGRVYNPDLAVNATPGGFLDAVAGLEAPVSPAWAGRAETAHAAYTAWSEPPASIPGDVQMGAVMSWLRDTLPDDAILTNGAGNYATWIHRFWHFRRFATQAAPVCGSMGYGLPAAVAAKLLHPERDVVCFAGDGCFQMTGLEFGTAVQEGANLIVLVIDNGMYGTIRMHQERDYPGRVSGTALTNPDFAALARAYGGHGETVERTEEFAPAFERARAAGRPAILHVKLDPEALTPNRSLSDIRAAGRQR